MSHALPWDPGWNTARRGAQGIGTAVGRVFCILTAALLCAAVSGGAAICGALAVELLDAVWRGLAPPWDLLLLPVAALGDGESLEFLVLGVLWTGLPCGCIAVWKLWHLRLVWAVPRIVGACAAVAFLLGGISPFLSMFFAPIAGLAAIAWCRMAHEWNLEDAASERAPST